MRLEYRFSDDDYSDYWYGPVNSVGPDEWVAKVLSRHEDSITVQVHYNDGSWIEYREYSSLSNVPETSLVEKHLVGAVAESIDRRG